MTRKHAMSGTRETHKLLIVILHFVEAMHACNDKDKSKLKKSNVASLHDTYYQERKFYSYPSWGAPKSF